MRVTAAPRDELGVGAVDNASAGAVPGGTLEKALTPAGAVALARLAHDPSAAALAADSGSNAARYGKAGVVGEDLHYLRVRALRFAGNAYVGVVDMRG